MTGSIHVCDDPISSQWQLGNLSARSGRLFLISLPGPADLTEGSVPIPLVRAMASAMTSVARVTFLSSEHSVEQERLAGLQWSHVEGDDVRAIPADGLLDWARAKLTGGPATIVQVSTQQAHVAERFFDGADYPLWLQVQLALLSAPGAPPPVVDRGTLFALMDKDWTSAAASLTGIGVLGVLRPGVDGDMLGFLSLDDAFGAAFVGAVEAAVTAASFGWARVSEEDF